MEELDLLKKDWNKDHYPKVSEIDIYGMLHKNSSSIVKWIFYVSVLEFVILNGIGLLLTDEKIEILLKKNMFFYVLQFVNYAVILVFIFLFYKNYKAISVLNNSKKLMELILKTRKVVTYYIYWNIIIGGFSGAIGAVIGFQDGYNSLDANKQNEMNIDINYVTLFIAMILIMGFVWLFYKLIYGKFLNKLKNNYSELVKIDL